MLRDAVLRAGRNALIALAMSIVIVALIAYIYSASVGATFYSTLDSFFLYGGCIIAVIGGLMGAGMSEASYVGNNLFSLNGSYQKAITEGRLERRKQQFFSMLLFVMIGLFLVFISILM